VDTTTHADALARFRELVPSWTSGPLPLEKLHKVLGKEGFGTEAIDGLVAILIDEGAVKSPNDKVLYPSEKARVDYLKQDAAAKLRVAAREKRKALRKAIKDTPKIERRYLYAGVLPKAIADDPALSVYAKMAAVVIDDRIHNFPKHHRRNRTIGFGELAERMGRGIHKTTAMKAVQELLDGVYLYVEEPGGGRRGNLYGFTSDIETYDRES